MVEPLFSHWSCEKYSKNVWYVRVKRELCFSFTVDSAGIFDDLLPCYPSSFLSCSWIDFPCHLSLRCVFGWRNSFKRIIWPNEWPSTLAWNFSPALFSCLLFHRHFESLRTLTSITNSESGEGKERLQMNDPQGKGNIDRQSVNDMMGEDLFLKWLRLQRQSQRRQEEEVSVY